MAPNYSAPAFKTATDGSSTTSPDKITTAIIPVGGLGTRMLPATMSTSKNMLNVGSRSLIEYAVEEALSAGCETVVIVCGPEDVDSYRNQFQLRDALKEKVGSKEDLQEAVAPLLEMGEHVRFVVQDEALGLGHAIYQANEYVKDRPFAVILPDDLILDGLEPSALPSMVDSYQGGIAVAAMPVSEEDTKKYGVFRLARDADTEADAIHAIGMVEKPQSNPPSNLAAIGRYILPSEVMNLLSEGKKGAGNEIQLTDALDEMVSSGQAQLFATRFRGERFDCGNKLGHLLANKHVTDLELTTHFGYEPDIETEQEQSAVFDR